MQFKPLNINLPLLKENLPIEDQIFRIDSDKLAYVQLIVDDGEGYSTKDPYKEWNSVALSKAISSRDKIVNRFLTENSNFSVNYIFMIKIFGRIGRPALIDIGLRDNRILLLFIEDLEVVSKLGDLDSLALWKYARAEEKYSFPPISSFLDRFSLYYAHNCSFYTDDRIKPDF